MSFDNKDPVDTEFERSLMASARGDAPPHDVQAAWTRFAGKLSMVVPAENMGSDLSHSPSSIGSVGAESIAMVARTGAVRAIAIKCLVLGAIGGSSVTTVVMNEHRTDKQESSMPTVDHRRETLASAPQTTPIPAAPAAPISPPLSVPRTVSSDVLPQRPRRQTKRSVQQQPETEPQTVQLLEPDLSNLAAEVARIDAARSASAAGDHGEAVRLIERYHMDFPQGALAPDADVVAIEAVTASNNRPEVVRRATLFLARYPDDPHAARVRWLAKVEM